MAPTKTSTQHNRQPGYDPRKIFDYWFCRGVQSAVFHYASCTDCKNHKAVKERQKQAAKRAKERAAEMAIVTEQPRQIPQMQPLPSETNQGWNVEIKMGREYDPRHTVDRRVSSANTVTVTRANIGDSDRYDHYRAKHPEIDTSSPPVICKLPPPERAHEVVWMKSPPPSRAVMEGKESPAVNAIPRWPLCIIEQTESEYERWIQNHQNHMASLRSMSYTPAEFKCPKGKKLTRHGKMIMGRHQLEWDVAQLDALIPDPSKQKEAHLKPSRLLQGVGIDSDCDSYETWHGPAGRYTTRENLAALSWTDYDGISPSVSTDSIWNTKKRRGAAMKCGRHTPLNSPKIRRNHLKLI